MRPNLSELHINQLASQGYMAEPSQYSDEPDIFTNKLFDDGKNNRVMTGPIMTNCPVHIIQGMEDEDVPFSHALKLTTFLPSQNVTLTLVKDGDHRMSRPQDIDMILRAIETMTSGY